MGRSRTGNKSKLMISAKYFSEAEFNRLTPSCSLQDIDQDFMQLLDKVREEAGIPLVLTCAYRSKEWDLSKGRSGNSAHTEGKAVDIRCYDSNTRFRIINAAIKCGINRIGINFHGNFIHLDNSDNLPRHVIWNYAN